MKPAVNKLKIQHAHMQWDLKRELHTLLTALMDRTSQALGCIKKQTLIMVSLTQLDLSNLKSTTKIQAQVLMMLVLKRQKTLPVHMLLEMKKELLSLVTLTMRICQDQVCIKKLIPILASHLLLELSNQRSTTKTLAQEHTMQAMRKLKIQLVLTLLEVKKEQLSLVIIKIMKINLVQECMKSQTPILVKLLHFLESSKRNTIKIQAQEHMMPVRNRLKILLELMLLVLKREILNSEVKVI